jgi:hypothetical protein
MECYFCKRDQNEINKVFASIINNFKIEISKYDSKIKSYKEEYARKNGFTNDNFEKVKNIDKNLLKIKINAFMDNLEPFINMDKNLQLLKDYFNTYSPDIQENETLYKLMNLYISEPTETRLGNKSFLYVKERDKLSRYIKEIEEKNKLIAVDDTLQIPLAAFDFDEKLKYKIIESNPKTDIKNEFLCPYCLYLLIISNNEIKEIKEKHTPEHLKLSRGTWDKSPLEE